MKPMKPVIFVSLLLGTLLALFFILTYGFVYAYRVQFLGWPMWEPPPGISKPN